MHVMRNNQPEQQNKLAIEIKPPRNRLKTVVGLGTAAAILTAGMSIKNKIDDINPFGGFSQRFHKTVESLNNLPDISQRRAMPLFIDPKDVVEGKVSGIQTYGKAVRNLLVEKAVKEYDGNWIMGDEKIVLLDGRYVLESNVEGQLYFVMDTEKKNLTIVLPNPTTNNDVRVVKDPIVDPRPGVFAAAVQAGPGAETKPDAALTELHDFVLGKQRTDKQLYSAAACWALNGVLETSRASLESVGVKVLVDGLPPVKETEYQPVSLVNYISPNERQTVTINPIIYGEQSSSFIGPELPKFNFVNCLPILAATSANGNINLNEPILSYVSLSSESVPQFTGITTKR